MTWKIPRKLLRDPDPKLTAKMRRAARDMGRAVRATLAPLTGGDPPPIRLVYGVGDRVLGRIVEGCAPPLPTINAHIVKIRAPAAETWRAELVAAFGADLLEVDPSVPEGTCVCVRDDGTTMPLTRLDVVRLMPDPVCAKACGVCWACRREKDGNLWWLAAPAPTPAQLDDAIALGVLGPELLAEAAARRAPARKMRRR